MIVWSAAAPTPVELAEWDRLVEDAPGSDVTQLSVWADIRAMVGYHPRYLLVRQDGRLVGGALVLHRRVGRLFRIAYVPYGPVLAEDVPRPDAARTVLVDGLAQIATSSHMMFVQPPEHGEDISSALLDRGFRPSDAEIAPVGSYRLDLSQDVVDIRARFSKRLKYWTNRWAAKGVTVRCGDERDLPLLVKLMACTGARQGFTPPSLDYLRALYLGLVRNGHAALFVGEVEGVPVSADMVTMCGGVVRGRLGGFDRSGVAGKLSVPAAVRWEILRRAKAQGHAWFDFGGLPERMLSDLIDHGIQDSGEWPGAHRSKISWGGAAFRYPAPVELIRPEMTRLVYDLTVRSGTGRRIVERAKSVMRAGPGTRYRNGAPRRRKPAAEVTGVGQCAGPPTTADLPS